MFTMKGTLVLLTCFLLFACGGQTVKPKPAQKPPQPAAEKGSISTEQKSTTILPIWVEDHRLVNYISAIGSSGLQALGGEQAQYNAAMQEARKNLSIEFKKHLYALEVRNKNIPTAEYEDEINQRVEMLLLENAIVQEEWKHPETGRIYLWLIIPEN
jgi:hypothetical protein